MVLLAIQPYIKVERKVDGIQQIDTEHERNLYLYHDRIVTEHREFLIGDILDISYRRIGHEGGLLYLHTLKGLFSYTVHIDPEKFIDAFKEHIEKW